MFANGVGVPASSVFAYALYNMSAVNDSSGASDATDKRTALMGKMTAREIDVAQGLARKMATPGNVLKALDQYVKHPAITEKFKPVAAGDIADPIASNNIYPERPAMVPGRTSCNTRCENASCYRTYDDGRKVRFQAKQKWNSFNNQFEFDSGSC